MRKFTITSPAYTGEASLIYADDGTLKVIDASLTNMPANVMQSFKAKVPAHVDAITECFANTQAVIVESDYEVTFDMFWEKYDLKRNKQDALKLWNKMSKQEKVIAFHSLYSYERYLLRNTWCNKMYPDTYLRGKHYHDEWNKIK